MARDEEADETMTQDDTKCTDSERQDVQELMQMGVSADMLALVEPPAWMDDRHQAVAVGLSLGLSHQDVADAVGVSRSSVSRWLTHPETGASFKRFIDRLSLITGDADRAELARKAKRLARTRFEEELRQPSRRHSWLDYARLLTELTGPKPAPLPAVIQQGRGTFVGVQVNVHDLVVGERGETIMSGSEAPDHSGEVVEGETRELEGTKDGE